MDLRKRRNHSAWWVLKHRHSDALAGTGPCTSPIGILWRRSDFLVIQIIHWLALSRELIFGEAFIEWHCSCVQGCKCCMTNPSEADFLEEGEKALKVVVSAHQDGWESAWFDSCIHSSFL